MGDGRREVADGYQLEWMPGCCSLKQHPCQRGKKWSRGERRFVSVEEGKEDDCWRDKKRRFYGSPFMCMQYMVIL